MNRRTFFHSGAAASLLGLFPSFLHSRSIDDPAQTPGIKPRRLKKGDTVGLIAPASFITEQQLQDAINAAEKMELKPVYSKTITSQYGYFSGTDERRAADINSMFADPEVQGILSVSGGYGCTRILDLIDYDIIKKNPKVIMGYSDVTALLNAIYQRTGLITFHGPIARAIPYDYDREIFENIIYNASSNYTLKSSAEDLERASEDPVFDRYTIHPGTVSGQLVGGNLSLVSAMTGTKYQLNMQDKIVFLEDIGEDPYRVDRMMTQLLESGELKKAAGIVLGIFKNCKVSDDSDPADSFTLREVMEDRIGPLNKPTAYGLSFGHNKNNMVLPIGVNVSFDAGAQTVTLLENAVV